MKTPTLPQTTTANKDHARLPWEDNGAGLIYGQVSGDDDEAPFVADVANDRTAAALGIITPQERTNAAFIVRACNAHSDMLEALELCVDCLADLARLDDGTPSISALNMARAAIAKATA
jgi:hypothetical protein